MFSINYFSTVPVDQPNAFTQLMMNKCPHIGSEVLIAMVINSSVLWNLKPCSPVEVRRHFGGTCSLPLQG
jgi:hypothetical protein